MFSGGIRVHAAIAATFTLLVTILVALPAHAVGTITGTVTGPDGQPVQGVTAEAYRTTAEQIPYSEPPVASAATGVNGTYTLTVPDGSYYVCFWSETLAEECYDNAPMGSGFNQDSGTAVSPGASGIDGSLGIGATISGTARTYNGSGTGYPIANVQVAALELIGDSAYFWGFASTDAQGHYSLTGLSPGVYYLCGVHQAYLQIARCWEDEWVYGTTSPVYVVHADSATGIDLSFYPAPQNPRVSKAGPTSIIWSWNGVIGASWYEGQLSAYSSFPSIRYTATSAKGVTTGNLTKGRRYYFRVSGVSSNDYLLTKPSRVVAGTPGIVNGLKLYSVNSTSFVWKWSPYVGAAKYQVQLSSYSDFRERRTKYTSSSDYNQGFTGLTAGKKYYVRVRALNSSGAGISGWGLSSATPGVSTVSSTSQMSAAGQGRGTLFDCSLPCRISMDALTRMAP